MHSVRVAGADSPLFARLWQIYEASFPPSERRGLAAQTRLFNNARYRLDAWLATGAMVGLIAWWEYDTYRYIEHLATAPESRDQGYGASILRTWMESDPSPVYIEIEEVADTLTARRLGFYKRLGFMETPYRTLQPPYQKGFAPVRMQVLSWPEAISAAQFTTLVQSLQSEIWARPE